MPTLLQGHAATPIVGLLVHPWHEPVDVSWSFSCTARRSLHVHALHVHDACARTQVQSQLLVVFCTVHADLHSSPVQADFTLGLCIVTSRCICACRLQAGLVHCDLALGLRIATPLYRTLVVSCAVQARQTSMLLTGSPCTACSGPQADSCSRYSAFIHGWSYRTPRGNTTRLPSNLVQTRVNLAAAAPSLSLQPRLLPIQLHSLAGQLDLQAASSSASTTHC